MEWGGTPMIKSTAQQSMVNISSVVHKDENGLKWRFLVVRHVPLMACKPWSASDMGQINAVCILPWESESLW